MTFELRQYDGNFILIGHQDSKVHFVSFWWLDSHFNRGYWERMIGSEMDLSDAMYAIWEYNSG